MTLITGDCVEVMAAMPEASVDAIVTDPPYGLEFMGKEWDRLWGTMEGEWKHRPKGGTHPFANKRPIYKAGQPAQAWHHRWATEALRVAKPGAYLLAFGGTRTVHRLACAIEDAGWIIRDTLVWAYASGFPKSKSLLKPAYEPIVMARKPGPLRELAIDACRIPTAPGDAVAMERANSPGSGRNVYHPPSDTFGRPTVSGPMDTTLGRWPSNLVLTDPIFDGGWDGVVGGGKSDGAAAPASGPTQTGPHQGVAMGRFNGMDRDPAFYGDAGTYSRFFLIPKAARAEREPGMPSGLESSVERSYAGGPLNRPEYQYSDGIKRTGRRPPRRNTHPTVKPLELMRHLVRLVTPTGGTCLDPFAGSGTTLIAAEMEGFGWLGIERELEYVRISEARLAGVQRGLGLSA